MLAIYLGLHQLHYLALPGLAFVGALAVALLVYGIAVTRGVAPLATMILAGAAISAFVSAVISAILTLLADANALREIIFWLTGSLAARSWTHVQTDRAAHPGGGSACCASLPATSTSCSWAKTRPAAWASTSVRTRLILLGLSSLVTAVGVAVSGVIGFVGLIVPHVSAPARGTGPPAAVSSQYPGGGHLSDLGRFRVADGLSGPRSCA